MAVGYACKGDRLSRNRWAVSLVVALSAGLLAAVPLGPAGAANLVVANWQMNEPAGATTLTDSSGNGIHGSIGSAVATGVSQNGATVYRWSNTSPNQPPAKPERLIQVDDGRLNPGSGDFAIEMRFRTSRSFGNMIQKGQSSNPGGYFKWEMPNGKLMCLFRGYDDQGVRQQKAVNSGATPLNDGVWHTVRCERKGDQLIMTIDNERTRKANGPTGRISNSVPMTIAGKLNCDQVTVTCDYFVGDIDYVTIEAAAPPNAPPPPTPRIFEDTFSNGMTQWTGATRISTTGAAGAPSPSAVIDVSGQSASAYKDLPGSYGTLCMSMDINQSVFGANVLMRFRTASNDPIARVLSDANGRLKVRSDVSGVTSGTLGELGSGWHNIDLCGTTGILSTWYLYRDGVKLLDGWMVDGTASGIGRVDIGDTAAKTWSAHIDNVVVDSGQG